MRFRPAAWRRLIAVGLAALCGAGSHRATAQSVVTFGPAHYLANQQFGMPGTAGFNSNSSSGQPCTPAGGTTPGGNGGERPNVPSAGGNQSVTYSPANGAAFDGTIVLAGSAGGAGGTGGSDLAQAGGVPAGMNGGAGGNAGAVTVTVAPGPLASATSNPVTNSGIIVYSLGGVGGAGGSDNHSGFSAGNGGTGGDGGAIALIHLGPQFKLARGLTVLASVDTELASAYSSIGGTVNLRYAW